ncbi:MAG: TAT-variant-translocated molybdopterin oxidoreductase [Gemmataceae bacterium]|nr:TAT-variant-translocated molybdopterin oxidoreductase [Gemmataceae bacterium]
MSGETTKRYWVSLGQRDDDANFLRAAENEFPETPGPDAGPNRRDFLRAAGFAFAGTMIAGCGEGPLPRAPVQHALPYATQPEEITPGRATYYASTCAACSAGCGLLVKTRDGRPIKLEGSPEHPLSHGGLCAVGQASVLGLYDRHRLQHPLRDGQRATWAEVDRDIRAHLQEVRRLGKAVRVLSTTVTSPTLRAAIGRLLGDSRDARHVVYDPLSCSAILDAHERTHGARVLPHYHFDRAEVIVSFDADFLGTWISPVEFAAAYRQGRSLAGSPPRLSYHAQFESRLSLTGAKADRRVRVAPGEVGLIVTHLARRLAERAGAAFDITGITPSPVPAELLDQLAARLWAARGRSLVVCGSQDVPAQVACNFLNHLLGTYGSTVDIAAPSYQRQGSDRDVAALLRELRQGRVGALFILDGNPVYDLPGGDELTNLLRRVPLVVSCAERADETAAVAKYVCPRPHYLASWSDAEPVAGLLTLTQPTLRPLGEARPVLESLAAWVGAPRPALALLQDHWRERVLPRQSSGRSFQASWDQAVHDGFTRVTPPAVQTRAFALNAVRPILRADQPAAEGFALVLYPKVGMLDGSQAYNPWLQELPDPITKSTWDNYACLSPAVASRLGLAEGDVVRLEAQGSPAVELPVLLQPGQHDGTVAVALGYGNRASARFAEVGPQWLEARPTLGPNGLVGVNAAPLLAWDGDTLRQVRGTVRLTRTNRRHTLALTQAHHTITVPPLLAPHGQQRRPMIQETTRDGLAAGWRAEPPSPHGQQEDLWPNDHPVTGSRWGMVIDLTACTGCSACVVACQVENNIPVVGKDEVQRQREMHWLRIDRYYSGDGGDVDVAFQPMLCQHCGNAPCETVCPVLATVHSSEGLNQQIYNRCVGTRYCANNCPYKVRRFNWFNYAHEDALQNLVLNPDVTVRSRGVMEKCSFCVQRIQNARAEARRRGEPMADGAIQTACQQSCPAHALVFGDLNDPRSEVSRLMRDQRRYRVLAELNVQPSIGYLGVVRNRPAGGGEEHRD